MEDFEKLSVKDFGPIKDAEVTFRKFTVFIGEQGAGKSTLAKLYALFTWLEKAITRHQIRIEEIENSSRFKKRYCTYNNIDSFFKQDTVLNFHGLHYEFSYNKGILKVSERKDNNDSFNIAKVMYVPAERNILGSVDHPSKLYGLPEALKSFLEEYGNAKVALKSGFDLPFSRAKFVYDMLNDMPKIRNHEYEIKLSEASSGFQTTLPLLLVSKYLSDMVLDRSKNSELNDQEKKALQKEVENIMHNEKLSDEVRDAMLASVSDKYRYSRFINIVEESELNQFPDSQKGVLYWLIADAQKVKGNQLVLTTHSPYILNYLTLSVKAAELNNVAKNNHVIRERIYEIVPVDSLVEISQLTIYQVGNGFVNELDYTSGIPSDSNYLNDMLQKTNEDYDSLLEIEEDLES